MASTVLYGRITRDIECRYTSQGTAVARFSIAVNRKYQQGDKKTDFFNIVSFGRRAETISQYFHQGSRIVVYCHPQQEQYTKQDGSRVDTISFILDDFDFVDTRAEGGIAQNQNNQQQAPAPAPENLDFMTISDDVDGFPFD